jgi:phosphoglycerol transferase
VSTAGWFRARRDAASAAAITGLLCVAGVWLVFAPLHDWMRYPLAYTDTADALANLWVIKTVIETGWVSVNPALGAPFGATVFDFPHPEVLFLLFYRSAGAFTSNVALIHNLFYLVGFPVVAWSALAVLRGELRVAWPLAVAGAFLFTWLPYHSQRLAHLHLSNYAVVPVAAWLLLRVTADRPPFFEQGRLRPAAAAVWLAVVALAWTSIYYTFFAIVLLAAAGVLEGIVARSLRPVASALLVSLAVAAALAVALAPVLRQRAIDGANPDAATRSFAESDVYALRPIHLVLPSDRHWLAPLASPARTYNPSAPLINENRTAALGITGAVGFLLLLAHLLTGHRSLPATHAMATLARANLIAVLFGVTGGLGAILALVVTPQFRSLNRVSVFIAFFSISAVIVAIDGLIARLGPRRRVVSHVVAGALIVLGFVDQRPADHPALGAVASTFDSDRTFVDRIERLLPAGGMVYQVPYTQFPEVLPFRREPLYSPMRLYLHSRTTRWSYGGMKGRPGDYWHRAVERLPWPQRAVVLRAAGFTGLVLDRHAIQDGGRADAGALAALGFAAPVDSADREFAFYVLAPAAPAVSPAGLLAAPARGFHPAEGEYPRHWSWTDGNADVFIHHGSSDGRTVDLTCVLRSLTPRRVVLRSPDDRHATVEISGAGWLCRCASPSLCTPAGIACGSKPISPRCGLRMGATRAASPSW